MKCSTPTRTPPRPGPDPVARPTLRDVAAKTGLSVTQVSRALNDHDDVAESTKALARAAAAELRYTPNIEARRLKDPGAAAETIGVILPNESLRFSDPFFGDLLSAMASEASANGLQLTLSTSADDRPPTEPYDLAVRRKQFDGFVILRTESADPRIDYLLDQDFPFVSFGRPLDRSGFPAVEASPECFHPVVDHLITLGHHNIACIAEPTRFAIGAARLAAFLEAAATAGIHVPADNIAEAGFQEDAGHETAIRLLRRSKRPTAIVALNDLMALGVLTAADELGVSVPQELSVIGFDDIRSAAQVRPSLTTVHQSATEVGTLLVQELLPAISAGTISHRQRWVKPTLVIRDSTGAAPSPERGQSHD